MNKEQARELTQSIISKAQTMRSFKVRMRVDDGWLPNGPVPFNIHIKNGVATLTIVADSIESARQMAMDYMPDSDSLD